MKLTNKRLDNLGKIVGFSILGFVLILVVLGLILYKGLLDSEKQLRGFVELPNNYVVLQVSKEGPYEIAAWNNADKQIVKPNILELDWDERYVLFKRIDETGEEIGVLDTKTKVVKSLSYSSDNLQKIKSEFGIAPDIALKSVASFWPDNTKRR